MSVTILEGLENAEHNFKGGDPMQKIIALNQLRNAIALLDKGYDAFDDFNEVMGDNEDVKDVPEKQPA